MFVQPVANGIRKKNINKPNTNPFEEKEILMLRQKSTCFNNILFL